VPKFPGPPGINELRALRADVVVLPAGTWIWRIYFRNPPARGGWNVFRSFGPVPKSRFDHLVPPPRVQDRSILYAASEALTCLAEVFQEDRIIDPTANDPWLTALAIEQELKLLNLAGKWPTAAGASMAINSGPRERAQDWSRAIYEAYPEIDGLWYGSSMNANKPSIALYERARDAIPESPIFNRALTDPSLATTLRLAADRFGYDLV
jgi:hypothetical protein